METKQRERSLFWQLATTHVDGLLRKLAASDASVYILI